jgi:hypothetical protein
MKQSTSLTHRILKLLYPQADLDVAGEGFAMTCTEEEANKLIEDSAVTTDQVMELLPVNKY